MIEKLVQNFYVKLQVSRDILSQTISDYLQFYLNNSRTMLVDSHHRFTVI